MNDIPDNIVAIVAIAVLGLIGAVALIRDFNHGILQTIIIMIAGLAGYKIKGIVDEKTIQELQALIKSDKPLENVDTA